MVEVIKILVADNHTLFCEGLSWLFERESDLCCVGVASDGELALKMARQLTPDVILMDISMPKLDGIETAKLIKETNPNIAIIMLTAYKYIHYVLNCMEAHIEGYLLKSIRRSELAEAIRLVKSGQTVYSSEVMKDAMCEICTNSSKYEVRLGTSKLHERELEIIKLVAEGKSNRAISDKLCISENTIATHLVNIFRKFGASSRIEVVLYALKAGLVKLDDVPYSE